jgi:hypothetical protein
LTDVVGGRFCAVGGVFDCSSELCIGGEVGGGIRLTSVLVEREHTDSDTGADLLSPDAYYVDAGYGV